MTGDQQGQDHARLRTSALASLVPVAAFLLVTAIADRHVDHTSRSLSALVAAAPFYVAFIGLPSLLPLAAARAGVTWLATLAAMTAVAAIAGIAVVTSDDAQAGLAALWVPLAAIPLALVLWVGQAVAARWSTARRPPNRHPLVPAEVSDRLAALAIDIAIVGVVLVVPLTAMSHAEQEVAAAVAGVAATTIFLAALVSARGATIGQALLGLAVVDAPTRTRVPLPRALVRSLIVVLEVAATATIVLAPLAFAELISASADGRSLTDRLLRTEVVTTG